jgi:hypothetical protein
VRKRVLTIVALSGLLFAPATAAFAGTASPQAPQGPQPTATAKATIKVTVVGDSFTSGEGANASSYKLVPVPNQVTISGQPVYTVDPAHQSSTAPTLQALSQIQAANPDANIVVTFVPVSGATRTSLYQTTRPGTPFEQAPQINAVKDADVVLVGIGGNDARFTDWITTVLSSKDSTSTAAFPQFMAQFNDGSYLANQVNLLNDVANLASPNATIVSLGYPKAMPAELPSTPTWWSPFSWSTISQGEANMSNQLAGALNTANEQASFTAGDAHPGQQFLYADVSNALQGHELFTSQEGLNGLDPGNTQGSYHPNDLGQRLLGTVLLPYVQQAINDQLAKQGVQGAPDVAPLDPNFPYMWNLRVQLPMQTQPKPPDTTAPKPDQPSQDQPAQDQPAQDQPAEDQPAQDQPAPDQPAQDQPAQDQPGQDQPAQDQPAQDQPAQPADSGTPADQPADAPQVPSATQPDSSTSDSADGSAPDADQPAAADSVPAADSAPADPAAVTDPATDGTAPAADPAPADPAADPAIDGTAPAADPAPADPDAGATPADPAADGTAPAADPAPADPAAATDPAATDPSATDPAADGTAPAADPAPADPAAAPAPDPAAEPAPAVAAPDPAPVVAAPPPIVVAPPPPPPAPIEVPDPVVTPVEVPTVPPVESDPDPGIDPIGDTGVIDDGGAGDTGIDSADPGDTGIDTGIDGGSDGGFGGDAGGGDGGGD